MDQCACEDLKKRITITPQTDAMRFTVDALTAAGVCRRFSEIVASNLFAADYRGIYSHGINRLYRYVNDIKKGDCNPNAEPTIIKQSSSTALVDGNNGMGAVIGKFCMDLAIAKAKAVGVGLVVCKGSNHYGISGLYAMQAIKESLIGITMTNTSPLVVPTGGKNVALGTNPIACGAPGHNGDHIVIDIATSAVAVGKIELAKQKGMQIPYGWALNECGEPELDPAAALRDKRLMPLGGVDCGHKGMALGIMVEVLCGLLAGSRYGPNIRVWGDENAPGGPANLGQCFLAIDPKCFAPFYECRVADFNQTLRNMEPADPNNPIMIPGDVEKKHMEKVEQDGGFRYPDKLLDQLNELAEELKIKPMRTFIIEEPLETIL